VRILSAAFDAILLPVAIAADSITILPRMASLDDGPSYTRTQIEKIEDNLRP